jgi:CheY-like chemotaxis protein
MNPRRRAPRTVSGSREALFRAVTAPVAPTSAEQVPATLVPSRRRLASAAAPTLLLAVEEHPAGRVRADSLSGAGFDVVGEASDGAEAVELAERLQPELLLMSLRLPVLNGQEVARLIRALAPSTQIVLVSSEEDPATVADCLQAGVFAVLARGASTPAICATLRGASLLAQPERQDRARPTARA